MTIKKALKKTFRFVRDIVTVRPLRKYVGRKIAMQKYRRIVQDVESRYTGRVVLIFQHAMFDTRGEKCFNGGAERYVTDLADILTDRGYTPVLIQMGDAGVGLWEQRVGNLRIFGMPVRDYLAVLPLFRKYEFAIYSGATHWGKKLHPNIMISHGITWDVHGHDVKPNDILSMFAGVDKFVSVDTNTISWLRTTFAKTLRHFDANYVPNYVDTSIYTPNPRKPDGHIQITFPRRAAPERGYWLMSAALPPIMEKYPNVVFDFVGFAHGDAINNDIKKLIAQFPGRVKHYVCAPDEMPAIYQRADISLVPTIYAEGTSLSCLEAQSTGNIVIATNIGGLPNLVFDGYNGLLINPDAYSLMTALDRVLADPDLQKKLSRNAVAVAAAFDKKNWIRRWGNIIDSMNTGETKK
ncbi:MAG: glycosyltransferase family 4 protein [Alphaproteobacteria bacterium]|nr:glycosyltransferase family 4 protein [Alphaproteobacteria bacterium]